MENGNNIIHLLVELHNTKLLEHVLNNDEVYKISDEKNNMVKPTHNVRCY